MTKKISFLEKNSEYSSDADEISGIVVLSDFDSYSNIAGSRVIVFNDTSDGDSAKHLLEKTEDLDTAFDAARNGHAEEISIERLVSFYIENSI